MMKKYYAFLIMVVGILGNQLAIADDDTVKKGANIGFLVSPPVIVTEFKSVTVATVMIANTGTVPTVIQPKLLHYFPGESNTPYSNDKMLVAKAQYPFGDISSKVIYSPKVLALNPGETGTLRLLVKRGDLPTGSYWLNILFSTKAPPTDLYQEEDNKKGMSTHVTMVYNQMNAVYLNVGESNANQAQVACKIEKNKIIFNIKNDTQYVFKPEFDIDYKADNGVDILTYKPISVLPLSEGVREITISKQLNSNTIEWRLTGVDTVNHLTCQMQ